MKFIILHLEVRDRRKLFGVSHGIQGWFKWRRNLCMNNGKLAFNTGYTKNVKDLCQMIHDIDISMYDVSFLKQSSINIKVYLY